MKPGYLSPEEIAAIERAVRRARAQEMARLFRVAFSALKLRFTRAKELRHA